MKHRTARLALAGLCLVAALVMTAQSVMSQEDIVVLSSPAFVPDQRPPAVFAHDAHNEKAQLDDCTMCHHGGQDGRIVEGEDSTGTPCVECHPVDPAPGQTGLMAAYHLQCKSCHLEMNKGPVTCGECHKLH